MLRAGACRIGLHVPSSWPLARALGVCPERGVGRSRGRWAGGPGRPLLPGHMTWGPPEWVLPEARRGLVIAAHRACASRGHRGPELVVRTVAPVSGGPVPACGDRPGGSLRSGHWAVAGRLRSVSASELRECWGGVLGFPVAVGGRSAAWAAGLPGGAGRSAAALSPADPAEHGVRQAPAGRGGRVPKQVPELHGRGRQDPLPGGLDQDEGSASHCSRRAGACPGARSPSCSLGSRRRPSGGSPCVPTGSGRRLGSLSPRQAGGAALGMKAAADRSAPSARRCGSRRERGRRPLRRRTRGRRCP